MKIPVEYFQKINYHKRSIVSNLFAGIGLYHAINHEDSYLQAGCAVIFPSIYMGYQSFKNQDKIIDKIKSLI